MNKTFKMLSVALATILAAGFISCTKEDNEQNLINGNKTAYTRVAISIPNSNPDGVRADADTSGEYEYGIEDEYKVNSAYLYFYKNGSFAKRVDISTFTQQTSGETTSGSTAVNEVWVSGTVPTEIADGTYNVYVLVNYMLSTDPVTETDLKDAVMSEISARINTIPTEGIPMSSRSNDGVMMQEGLAIASATNTADNPATIELTVERSWAKLALAANTTDNTYSVYEDGATSGTEIAKVTLNGYKILNLAKANYAFRHVGKLTSTGSASAVAYGKNTKTLPTESTAAADLDSEGDYPDFITPNSSNFIEANASSTDAWLFDETSYTNYPTSTDFTRIAYSYENSAYKDWQLQGFGTGLSFKATVSPDRVYTGADTYFEGTDINSTNLADYDSLYFIANKFFASIDALKAYYPSFTDLTVYNRAEKGIKAFALSDTKDSFTCYYKYYIKHFDNGIQGVMGASEYCIIRNNVYNMKVTSILFIGDEKDDETPDTPIEASKSYLKVTLNIKPWIVRDNSDISLGE